jgi:MtrB/PioB family decaheme-associated outer membrane protein
VLLLAPGLALAQVDTSEWLCEACPFDDGYRGNIEAGATSVSDDAARFGNYSGLDEEGVYGDLNGQGRYASEGYRLDWTLEDLGYDSRVFELSGGKQGVFGFDVGYRELPHRRFDTTSTVFLRAASDTLTLPAGWVPAGTTGGMTQLASSLQQVLIGTDRQIIDVGADWTPSTAFRLFADFRRQTKDGIDITGGAGYSQASLLPRFVDYETDQVDAGVQYSNGNFAVSFAYYGSFFTNNNPSLSWETPFTASPGAETPTMASPPDNDFSQVSLSGKYRLSTWDTVIAFLAASGKGEQNSDLLPYTSNPTIPASLILNAPLNAEVDTANYALTLTARPFEKARVKVAYRYDERDNKTPVSDWTRVIVDIVDSGEVEQNVPYSFDRSHFSLSGEYAVLPKLKLSAGYDRRELNRDYQEVAEQTTDTGWGQLRWQPAAWLDLRAKGGGSRRGIDRYDETVAVSLGQNPLMRKYNLAFRDRTFGEMVAVIAPVEKPVSLTATVLFADDDYTESYLGLNGSEEIRASADLSWAVSESAAVYLTYGRDAIDAHQTGSEQFGFWDWSAFHEDTFDHVGFGMSWRPVESKFAFNFSFDRGEGLTQITLDSLSGGLSQLPDLESTLDSLRIEAEYAFSERLVGTFDLRYEAFELKDWALVSQTTIPSVLTLGAQAYDYDVYALGIGVRYRFGAEEITLAD